MPVTQLIGALDFDKQAAVDNQIGSLRADMLALVCHREDGLCDAGDLNRFIELFDEQHLDFEYKEEWMQGVAETIRAAESSPVDSSASKPDSLTNPQGLTPFASLPSLPN